MDDMHLLLVAMEFDRDKYIRYVLILDEKIDRLKRDIYDLEK